MVEGMWICTSGYRRLRGEWVKHLDSVLNSRKTTSGGKKCFYPSRKPLKCDDSTNSYWAICYYHNVCYSTHKVFLIFGYRCFLTAKTAAVHMVSVSSSAHDWIAIFCLLFGRKSLMYKPIPQVIYRGVGGWGKGWNNNCYKSYSYLFRISCQKTKTNRKWSVTC